MLSKKNINRLVAVVLLWGIAIAIVQGKLLGLQLLSSKSFREKARQQQRKPQDIPAKRGAIFDRNGVALSIDNLFYDIYGDPSQITDAGKIDSVLCQILNRSKGYYLERINNAYGRFFVHLERKVDVPIAAEIRRYKLQGVGMTPIYNRFYPYGQIASTVVGCVGHDGEGLDGIEYLYDEELSGTPAQKIVFADAFGRKYPLLCYSTGEPIPGNDLHLTIDIRLQQILETELKNTIAENHAEAAHGIFITPATGEILAMASLPNYDPNEYSRYPLNLRRNRAITDPYEPGSIFKLITVAAALNEGIVSPSDTIATNKGKAHICGREVTDIHGYGDLSVSEVISHSSNVGIVKIAGMLDKKTLHEYMRRFGFGTISGIDLPGEAEGTLRPPEKWWGTSMATIPMGYEVSSTPLQITCAYGAVANHGRLMRPFVVKKCVRYNEEVEWLKNPMVVRQAIPQNIADSLGEMFHRVVVEGSGKNANSKFVAVAGKTGTSHKQKKGERGYYESRYYSSFVGYAPYRSSIVVGLIIVDNPGAGMYYGGLVAAPVFKNILEKAISSGILTLPSTTRIAIDAGRTDKLAFVPHLIRTTPEQASKILKKRGLSPKFYGVGNIVAEQSPEAGRIIEPGSVIIVRLKQLPVRSDDSLIVPDVIGLSLRSAIDKLARAGVHCKIEGSGVVASQCPEPNAIIDTNEMCILFCQPKGKM